MAENPFSSSPYSLPSTDFVDATPSAPAARGMAPTVADVMKRAQELDIDPKLALSFFSQESSGNWNSKDSSKGARGGFQVMPDTYTGMMGTSAGQRNPWNNMEAGLRYIAYGQKTLGTKDPELLAAGYHAGYDRKDLKAGRIPNTSDGQISTADYARSVAGRVRGERPSRFPNSKPAAAASSADEFSDTPVTPQTSLDDEFSDTPITSFSDTAPAAPVDTKIANDMPEKGYIDRLKEDTAEGFGDTQRSLTASAWAFGLADEKALAEDMAKSFQQQAAKPKNAAQQEIDAAYKGVSDANGVIDTTIAGAKALGTSLMNPKETSLEIARNAANSLPTMAGGAAGAGAGAGVGAGVGALAGGVGAIPGAISGAIIGGRTGMAAGTTMTELGGEVTDMVQKRLAENKQPPTAQNILAILSDNDFRTAAREQGLKKGLTVAAVDQVFMGIGGKIATAPARSIASKALEEQGADMATRAARNAALASPAGKAALEAAKPSVGAKVAAGGAAVAVDAAGESIGEGASQKVARGEVDYGEALREGVMSIGQSAVEVGAGVTIETAKRAGATAKAAVTPTPNAPSTASGPLARAAENAAAEPQRVTVTAPDGQVSGTVTGATQDGTAVQIVGDDGQVYTFATGAKGIQITPEAPNTPLSNALEVASDAAAPEATPAEAVETEAAAPSIDASAPDVIDPVTGETIKATDPRYADVVALKGSAASPEARAAVEAAKPAEPVAEPAKAEETFTDVPSPVVSNTPAPVKTPALGDMSDDELKARLKYIADQAKTNGGWNKMLVEQRRTVEKEINARADKVKPAAEESSVAQPVVQSTPAQQAAATLPKDLAGAKPRYNYGKKSFELNFASDVDRAAFIASQPTKSKRDADYLAFAMQATGMSEDEVRAHGAQVREAIKAMAKDGKPGTLKVAEVARGVKVEKTPAPSYDQRNQERIARVKQAATADDLAAIQDEENGDSERHFEGTDKLRMAINDRKSSLKAEKAKADEQAQYDAGEWVSVSAHGSRSAADQEAAAAAKADPLNEYRSRGGQNDGYEVVKRKKQSPTTAELMQAAQANGKLEIVNVTNKVEPKVAAPSVDKKNLGPNDAIMSAGEFASDSDEAWFNTETNRLETKYVNGTQVKHYAGDQTANGVANLQAITTPEQARKAVEDGKTFLTVADGSTVLTPKPTTAEAPKLTKMTKAEEEHLFGTDKKRAAAMDRIAKGTAYFGSKEKAQDFIKKNGLSDTHEVVQTGKVRFEVMAKQDNGAKQTKTDIITEHRVTNADGRPATLKIYRLKSDPSKVDQVKVQTDGESAALTLGSQGVVTDDQLIKNLTDTEIINVSSTDTSGKPASAEAVVEKADAGQAEATPVQPAAPTQEVSQPTTLAERRNKAKEVRSEGTHMATGRADFEAGKPRVLPSYYMKPGDKNSKDWYRGWDAAKADASVATGQNDELDAEMRSYEAKADAMAEGAKAAKAGFKRSPVAAAIASVDTEKQVRRVEQVIANHTTGWANNPRIVVVADMNDPRIPAYIREANASEQAANTNLGQIRGFYHEDTLFMVASQLETDMDTAQVLFHEGLGHYGLRGVFGEGLNAVLQQVVALRKKDVIAKINEYQLSKNMAEARAAVLKDNPELKGDALERAATTRLEDDYLEAAEEVLADMAMTTPQLGFVKRAIAAIRSWLRQNVKGFADMELSDGEIIRNYILPARAFVEQGSVRNLRMANGTRASRARNINDELRTRGEQIVNTDDALRRMAAGEEIYGFHEQMDEEDQEPTLLTRAAEVMALAPDQMLALKPQRSPVRFNRAPAAPSPAPAGLVLPEQGLLRRVQSAIQDNFNRVRQVQERITAITGQPIAERSNYYGAETNRPGRIAARLEDAKRTMIEPLMAKLAKSGHSMEELSSLLHAMHAKERNDMIARINPDMPDGGSGMMTADAQAIIDKYRGNKTLNALADEAREITKATLELKLAYGLIDVETFATLAEFYKNYVPLKGDGEYGPKVKRAMGHEERDEHILENIARDYDQAVVAGEKNLARQSLLSMVLENPDPELWTVGVPPKGRYVAGTVFSIMKGPNEVATFTSQAQVSAFLEAKGGQAGQYDVMVNGERVREFAKPLQDNEVMVYVDGKPVRIQIVGDDQLARQLRPLNAGQMNPILEFMRSTNRWLSKVYTGYNPAFIIKNTARDAMTGTINIAGNEGAAVAAKAWAKYPASLKALTIYAATGKVPAGETGKMLDEYRQHGGKTGASYMSDLEEQGKTLQRMYDDAYGAKGYLADGKAGKAAVIAGRKIVGGMAHGIEILNQATENALRLALYTTMRQQGASAGEAAQAAKSVTVDFDRKGSMSPELGAIYLFFNPAVQGTANALKTLFKGAKKEQAWMALGALAALGFYAASSGMDDDKDRWLGEGWESRAKHMMFNMGGYTIKVPVSLEFAPFYAFGVAMAEAKRGAQSKMATAGHVVSSFIDAYFPLQGMFSSESDNHAMDAAMATVPTMLKPGVQIAANRNSFGSQVVPENEFTKDRPDNLKMFRGTKGTAYDAAAQGIAAAGELTGAGKYENDITKVSPETLKMLWRTYTGGLGQFVTDTAGLANVGVQDGANLETSDVPIVKDFVKTNDVKAIRGRFYDLTKEARASITEFEQAKKAGDGDAMDKIMDTPEKEELVSLGRMIRSTTKAAAGIRDEMVDINADKALSLADKRAKLKALEKEEEALYRDAIKAFQR